MRWHLRIATILLNLLILAPTPQLAMVTTKRNQPGQLVGVNLAGLDFGVQTDGSISNGYVVPPTDQASHFLQMGFTTFRVPFGWGHIQKTLGGPLDEHFVGLLKGVLDNIWQADPKTPVILDLHAYARRDGHIIGQSNGAVTDEHFADIWKRLASLFADDSRVIFGLCNEPHDVDLKQFAKSLQLAVNAIREVGAVTQQILLPIGDWTHVVNLPDYIDIVTTITDPVAKSGHAKRWTESFSDQVHSLVAKVKRNNHVNHDKNHHGHTGHGQHGQQSGVQPVPLYKPPPTVVNPPKPDSSGTRTKPVVKPPPALPKKPQPGSTSSGSSLLLVDLHQYLDSDMSGRSPECTNSHAEGFTTAAELLRKYKWRAMITELGGGNTQSCKDKMTEALQTIHANSDVFAGVYMWAAGAFSSGYELSLVPATLNMEHSMLTCVTRALGL